ncbi:MAG TPA: acetylxylan esterase [Chloroflexota bacterium]|nr:acetylxylan esterase [Chloroflexota bacterium]
MTEEAADARRKELYGLLGALPPRDREVGVDVVWREEREEYVLEALTLDLNGIEPVPAYFTAPRAAPRGKRLPVVLYNHAHGGDYVLGKDELLRGRNALQSPPYAAALAARGIAALCIDAWNFGERRGRTESELFKALLWKGQVLWGLMVYDTLRATDYLVSRPDVDATRIASLGLSMGSTMAWWHAALDERVRVCVDLCCLTDYQALIETRNLDGHGLYYYVPDLLNHFTAAEINALISPRAHLSIAGELDRLTPPAGLDRIDAELQRVYSTAGAAERWELRRYRTGHFETHDMRARVLAFLDRFLLDAFE